MAKFIFSALVMDARGKFGNAVFSANRAGQYIRQLVIPSNPKTQDQSYTREALSIVSKAWRGLTDAQRAGWNAVAPQYTGKNIFAQDVKLSGYQVFLKLNLALWPASFGMLRNSVPPTAAIEITATATMTTTTAEAIFTYLGGVAPTENGNRVKIEATPGIGTGISKASRNDYRVLGAVGSAAWPITFNFYNLYINKFGVPTAGSKVFLRFTMLQADGGIGSVKEVEVIVGA